MVLSQGGDLLLDAWATYFDSLLSPSDDTSFDSQHKPQILSEYDLILNATNVLPSSLSFNLNEVQEASCSLSKGKAPGPDGLDSEHIIYGGTALADCLTVLFNTIVASQYVPKSFRNGFTVPFLKRPTKDCTNPSNYRGISLLSNLSKVFEKLLLKRLQNVIDLSPLQGGFRDSLSCSHSLFILQEAVQSIRERKEKVYVTFLDAQKAFDIVWHPGLFVKLHRLGVPQCLLNVLVNWYNNSCCSVLWDSLHSRQVRISQGVRQGAISSPFLYSVYVNDLLLELANSKKGAMIKDHYVGAPMYADELSLVSSSPIILQDMLDIVLSYSRKWQYKINPNKSWILVFGESGPVRSRNQQTRSWFSAPIQYLNESDEVKHL